MTTDVSHLDPAVQQALLADMTIDITTTGVQSGEPRRIEIWFVNVDGTIYITGTPGPRDWMANLQANPAMTLHLKESVTADLAARATVVTNADERRAVFADQSSAWYLQQGVGIETLVAVAPMVRVDFD